MRPLVTAYIKPCLEQLHLFSLFAFVAFVRIPGSVDCTLDIFVCGVPATVRMDAATVQGQEASVAHGVGAPSREDLLVSGPVPSAGVASHPYQAECDPRHTRTPGSVVSD